MPQRDIEDGLINIRAWTDICNYSDRRDDCITNFERILETMNRLYGLIVTVRGELSLFRFSAETRDLIDEIICKISEQIEYERD